MPPRSSREHPQPSARESARPAVDRPFADGPRDGDGAESREEPFAAATLGTVLGGIAGGVVGGPAGAVAGGALGAAGGAAVGDEARQAAEETTPGGHRRARRRRRLRPRRGAGRTRIQAALAGAELDATQGVPASTGPTPVNVPDPSRRRGGG